ncbi:MAG: DNA polymerase, partial [Treponema sp.]
IQVIDLLALMGDTADNIPGVKGIGVKTAGKLLSDYKTLDGIYQNIQKISGSVQKKLIDGKENAFKSRDLIELCYDVPCPKIDEALNHEEYNFSFANAGELLKNYGAFQVAKAFSELALENGEKVSNAQENNSSNQAENSQIQTTDSSFLENKKTFQQPVKNSGNYKGIFNSSELEKFINSAIENKTVALDLETDSLDTQCAQILGFSLCFKEKNAVYVPIFQGESLFDSDGISKQDAFIQLKRLFLDESVNLIFHNAKFDLKVLAKNGLFGKDLLSLSNETSAQTLSSIIKCKIHDTMIAFWLENPEKNGKSLGLEYLAETFLGLKGIEFSEIVKKGETFKSVPIDQAISYAAEDADFTFQLFSIIKNITESNLYSLEIQVLLILAQMELTGLHLEKQALYDYKTELQAKIQETEEKIYSEVKHPFNIASPKQLQTVLFEERKLPTGKKTKTGYSTDTSVLEELSEFDIVPKMILEYRELAKLLSTYVETLPEMTDNNDRIHTDFVQTGTATGRLSSREPNLQNIPVRNEAGRKIRTAFTSTKGKILISADYSQIELVVLAHLSGDENMCRAFKEGTDVHRSTASLIFGVAP